MGRINLKQDVFSAAVERMRVLFAEGHRVVVSFSAGKDSGCSVEICLIAMKLAGQGNAGSPKLDVVMRDEEILFPGSFEYAERMAARPDVNFRWLVAGQPIINIFNRAAPYWWVFDKRLPPEKWVRQPPAFAEWIPDNNIAAISTTARFPPPPGKDLIRVQGLRAAESQRRLMGVHAARGYLTRPIAPNFRGASPIYDWRDEDVWKAISDNKWDMNTAYDVMFRMGVPKKGLRIAPPTLNPASASSLAIAQKAWPRWFDLVAERLPGVRTAAQFGARVCQPYRRYGETWEQCFWRECVTDAPPWVADRSREMAAWLKDMHSRHSTTEVPERVACTACHGPVKTWRKLAEAMYSGDPFALKANLDYVQPEFFREGAGQWTGDPACP